MFASVLSHCIGKARKTRHMDASATFILHPASDSSPCQDDHNSVLLSAICPPQMLSSARAKENDRLEYKIPFLQLLEMVRAACWEDMRF